MLEINYRVQEKGLFALEIARHRAASRVASVNPPLDSQSAILGRILLHSPNHLEGFCMVDANYISFDSPMGTMSGLYCLFVDRTGLPEDRTSFFPSCCEFLLSQKSGPTVVLCSNERNSIRFSSRRGELHRFALESDFHPSTPSAVRSGDRERIFTRDDRRENCSCEKKMKPKPTPLELSPSSLDDERTRTCLS